MYELTHEVKSNLVSTELRLNPYTKVETGELIAQVATDNPTFSVAWHPSKLLLAFTCDDKDKYHKDRDAGTVKLYGLAKE